MRYTNLISIGILFLLLWLTARFLLPIIFPFLLGLALALVSEPLVALLQRRLKLPRAICAGMGVSLSFCTLALIICVLCAFAVRELGVLAGILPDLEDTARSGMALAQQQLLNLTDRIPRSIRPLLQQNVRGFFSDGNALLNRVVQYVLGLAGKLLTHVPESALALGTGIISAFMLSSKLPRLRSWLDSRIPREKLYRLLQNLGRLKRAVGGWLLAQLKLSCVSAAILALGLLLLRIPNAIAWALGISLVDAFPILGIGTVLLPWSLILLLQGDTARAIGMVGIFVVVSVVRSVLEPKLVGRQLGLDPLVTLIALYAGYKLWGIGGMILSPLLAVTAIQLIPKRSDTL